MEFVCDQCEHEIETKGHPDLMRQFHQSEPFRMECSCGGYLLPNPTEGSLTDEQKAQFWLYILMPQDWDLFDHKMGEEMFEKYTDLDLFGFFPED